MGFYNSKAAAPNEIPVVLQGSSLERALLCVFTKTTSRDSCTESRPGHIGRQEYPRSHPLPTSSETTLPHLRLLTTKQPLSVSWDADTLLIMQGHFTEGFLKCSRK